jgi:hypothetical protein
MKEPKTIRGKVNRIMQSDWPGPEKIAALRVLWESETGLARAMAPWTVTFAVQEWIQKNGWPELEQHFAFELKVWLEQNSQAVKPGA